MEIRNSIVLKDSMSPVLSRIMTSLRSTLKVMKSSSGETQLFKVAERDIQLADEELKKFNSELERTERISRKISSNGGIMGTLKNIATPAMGLFSIIELTNRGINKLHELTELGDRFTNLDARIKNMGDTNNTVGQIDSMIFQSAQRARADYLATANSVTRLGILAGTAFKDTQGNINTAEVIKFNELINKAFVVGGSTKSEQASAIYQLTQAMGAGRLQGEDMRAVRGTAPLLVNAIRQYMGLSGEEFKKAQEEGRITSEIVKAAIFEFGTEIEQKFSQMPITVEQSMTLSGNAIKKGLKEPLQEVNEFVVRVLGSLLMYSDKIAIVFSAVIGAVVICVLLNLTSTFNTLWPKVLATATSFLLLNSQVILIVGTVMLLIALFLKFPEVFGTVIGAIAMVFFSFYNMIILFINACIKGINAIRQLNAERNGQKVNLIDTIDLVDIDKLNQKIKGSTVDFANNLNTTMDNVFNPLKDVGKTLLNSKIVSDNAFTSGGILGNPKPNIGTIDNIKSGSVSLDEDSIKYLNEQGMIEFVNRYTTMSPNIHLQFGDIRETADVDQIIEHVVDVIQDAYVTSLEGA